MRYTKLLLIVSIILLLHHVSATECIGPSEDQISGSSTPYAAEYGSTIMISCSASSPYYTISASSDAADNCSVISFLPGRADFACTVTQPYEKYDAFCIVCDPTKGDNCCTKKYVGTTNVMCNTYGGICETDSQCCSGTCATIRSFGFLKRYCLKGYYYISGTVKSEYGSPIKGATVVVKESDSESARVLATTSTDAYGRYMTRLIPSPYDYGKDRVHVEVTKSCYNFISDDSQDFSLESNRNVDFIGLLSGCECAAGQTRSCGEGECGGQQTCIDGSWSTCSSEGKDCGTCCMCDHSGDYFYDSNQQTDCDPFDAPELDTCYYSPDDNPYTLDTAPEIQSSCTDLFTCTVPTRAITHKCSVTCGADPACDGKIPGSDGCSFDCTAYQCVYDGIWGNGHQFFCNADGTYQFCENNQYEQSGLCSQNCGADPACEGLFAGEGLCDAQCKQVQCTDDGYWGQGHQYMCNADGTYQYCDEGVYNSSKICTSECGADVECDQKTVSNDACDDTCHVISSECQVDGFWGDGHEYRCLPDNTYEECRGGEYVHMDICKDRCSSSQACDGFAPSTRLSTCTGYGKTYLVDACDNNCQIYDTQYCSDSDDCTADAQCNNIERGTGVCDSTCTFTGIECVPGSNRSCGTGECQGIQSCSAQGYWNECSSQDMDCGTCCLCDNGGPKFVQEDADCDIYSYEPKAWCDQENGTLITTQGFESVCLSISICSTKDPSTTIMCNSSCGADRECDGLAPGIGSCDDRCSYIPPAECQRDGLWGSGHEFMCLEDNTYLKCNDQATGYEHVDLCIARCSASQACDGFTPGEILESCSTYGKDYLPDKCDENCHIKDISYCESDYNCTADPECDGILVGTDDCDNTCNFIGGECILGQTKECGTDVCVGIQFCTDNRTWSECSTSGYDCGICCVCDNTGGLVYDPDQDQDCDDFDLDPVSYCDSIPDNNPYTLDTASGFDSTCTSLHVCTTSSYDYSHTCDMEECGAQCEQDSDCMDNQCNETYTDYCDDAYTIDFNKNSELDEYHVIDTCENTCDSCACTDCDVNCSIEWPEPQCISGLCGADCVYDSDCQPTDCSDQNICIGSLYYNYTEQPTSCLNCTCVTGNCTDYIIQDTDYDQDGYNAECEGDCNDNNPYVFPGAEELCDGIDNDCDGFVDEGLMEKKPQQSIRSEGGYLYVFNGYSDRPYSKAKFSGWVRSFDASGSASVEIISTNPQNQEAKLYLAMENIRVLEDNCKQLLVETFGRGTYYIANKPYRTVAGKTTYVFNRLKNEVSIYMNQSFDLRLEHMHVTFAN